MIKYKFTENEVYSQFFSFEVLNYYDSIATNENFEWIENYFNILMKNENINAEKFDMHHIRPCCTFKDEEHKTRKQTEKLANEFNGNIIKLSYKNHIMAHYFLWKMFPKDKKFRRAIYMMLGKLDFEYLTENEIIKFAEIQEECKKANMTKEERKVQIREYEKINKDKISTRKKKYREEHKEEIKKYKEEHKEEIKAYRKNHKNETKQYNKKYREEHKEEIKKYNKTYRKEHKEEMQKYNKTYYTEHKEEIKKYGENHREEIKQRGKKYGNQLCYDPKKQDYCKYNTLKRRIQRNRELYKGVILKDCIIK